jgi:hypothetical protein
VSREAFKNHSFLPQNNIPLNCKIACAIYDVGTYGAVNCSQLIGFLVDE